MELILDTTSYSGTAVPGAAALITAAGTSFRFGANQKKEFFPFLGETVLHHTFMAFMNTNLFTYYCITFLKNHEKETRHALGKKVIQTLGDRLILVEGGSTRQESVYRGLKALKQSRPPFVLIHDGARPWVSARIIVQVYQEVCKNGAAAPVIPSVDAMKSIDSEGRIRGHLDRPSTVSVQTPQGFLYPAILDAHFLAKKDGNRYIDDTEIYHRYCGDVSTVPGDIRNTKITYPSDIHDALSAYPHALEKQPGEQTEIMPSLETGTK